MEDAELMHWIEDKIVAGVGHDDIAMHVAERAGISWQDAELLVEDVFQQRQGHINRRQGPLMLAISLSVFAGGALASYALYAEIAGYIAAADLPGNPQIILMALFSDAPRLMVATAFALAASAAGAGGVIKTLNGMMQS